MMVSEYQLGVRMSREVQERLAIVAKHNNLAPSAFVRQLVEETVGIVRKLEIPPMEAPRRFKRPTTDAPGRQRRRSRS